MFEMTALVSKQLSASASAARAGPVRGGAACCQGGSSTVTGGGPFVFVGAAWRGGCSANTGRRGAGPAAAAGAGQRTCAECGAQGQGSGTGRAPAPIRRTRAVPPRRCTRGGARRARPSARTPLSTYRLQLTPDFGFAAAPSAGALPPAAGRHPPLSLAVPAATPGSRTATTWSITPSSTRSSATQDAFARCARRCGARGWAQVLDVVPNHMGIERDNALWCGRAGERPLQPSSPAFFDIDWRPGEGGARGQGAAAHPRGPVRRVLERGELKLAFQDGALLRATTTITACRWRRASTRACWSRGLERLAQRWARAMRTSSSCSPSSPRCATCRRAPRRSRARVKERAREKEVIKRRLAARGGGEPRGRGLRRART